MGQLQSAYDNIPKESKIFLLLAGDSDIDQVNMSKEVLDEGEVRLGQQRK